VRSIRARIRRRCGEDVVIGIGQRCRRRKANRCSRRSRYRHRARQRPDQSPARCRRGDDGVGRHAPPMRETDRGKSIARRGASRPPLIGKDGIAEDRRPPLLRARRHSRATRCCDVSDQPPEASAARVVDVRRRLRGFQSMTRVGRRCRRRLVARIRRADIRRPAVSRIVRNLPRSGPPRPCEICRPPHAGRATADGKV